MGGKVAYRGGLVPVSGDSQNPALMAPNPPPLYSRGPVSLPAVKFNMLKGTVFISVL